MAKGKLQKTDNIMASFVSFPLAMILSVLCQFSFGHDIVCPLKFPFGRDIVCLLSVSFRHDIVCLLSVSLWPYYYLSLVSFPLSMILSVFHQFPFGHDIIYLLLVSL
jgi:hypothetical protein